MRKRAMVYVAGPMSEGNLVRHVRKALGEAYVLREHGYVPVLPHSSVLSDLVYPRTWQAWMDEDYTLLASCQFMIRIPGESKGADQEERWAGELGISVYVSASSLVSMRGREVCHQRQAVPAPVELLAALDKAIAELDHAKSLLSAAGL